MNRFFIEECQIADGILTVTGPDVNHIRNVLRMREGDDLEAVDETGVVSTCRITSVSPDEVRAEVLFSEKGETELASRICLFQGLPKSDKMELIIQKAVELGASEIVPVVTARTVVHPDEKKAGKKRARFQAIAEAAAKQSKRAKIPAVGDVVSFREEMAAAKAYDRILIPYECASGIGHTREVLSSIRNGESVCVFIGPEGGFSADEIRLAEEAGAEVLSLGERILRTETAAITTMSLLMFFLS